MGGLATLRLISELPPCARFAPSVNSLRCSQNLGIETACIKVERTLGNLARDYGCLDSYLVTRKSGTFVDARFWTS